MHGLGRCATLFQSQRVASHQQARGGDRLLSWSGGCREVAAGASGSSLFWKPDSKGHHLLWSAAQVRANASGVRDSNLFGSNVVTSNSGLVVVWGGKTNQRFSRRRHNTVFSPHCGLRDLQILSTSCFAINLVGLALTVACASTLLTSESRCLGSTQSNLILDAGRHGSGTSPFTLSPNIFQSSAGSKPGLAVYVEHSITSNFICVLRNTERASAFVVENPQSSRCTVEKCG